METNQIELDGQIKTIEVNLHVDTIEDLEPETPTPPSSGTISEEQLEEIIGLMIPHDCNEDFNEDFAI